MDPLAGPPSPSSGKMKLVVKDRAEAAAAAAAAADGEGEKVLILFFKYRSGDAAYGLFMIPVPDLSGTSKEFCSFQNEPKNSVQPIFEFPRGFYPNDMCCVVLESKLYLFGGTGLKKKSPPRDVYVIDIGPDIFFGALERANPLSWMKKLARMRTGKPCPYAFVARDNIYVIDNTEPVCDRSDKHLFEVFYPKGNTWKPLPHPPYDVVVVGHVVVDDKFFLSDDLTNSLLCFDISKSVWIKQFKYTFSSNRCMFGGIGTVLDDTLYALSDYNGALPTAYGFSTKQMYQTLAQCVPGTNPQRQRLRQWPPTELFRDRTLLSRESLKHIHGHAYNPWLSTDMIYLGNRIFCYIQSGPFPHEDDPKYSGLLVFFFKPHPGIVTEKFEGSIAKRFSGDFLTSSHIKISPRGKICGLQGCFSVDKPNWNVHIDDHEGILQTMKKSMTISAEK